MAGFGAHGDDELRVEVAAAAARLIAEEGVDYATAKRRAARMLLGDGPARSALPANDLIESELRRYLRTFGADEHRALLDGLRRIALELMDYLAPFNPHLVGAVLNGTATEHSDLHLQLFTDSAKDVEIFLLNDQVPFEVDEAQEPGSLETVHLLVPRRLRGGRDRPLGAVLTILPTDSIRVASRFRSDDPDLSAVENAGRANALALRALLAAPRPASA